MEVESDPEEGVLKSISLAVKERKKGIPVRVVFGNDIPKDLENKLIKKLDIDDLDIISIGGKYHNNKDLMKFPKIDDPSLVNEKWINNKDKDLSKTLLYLMPFKKKII